MMKKSRINIVLFLLIAANSFAQTSGYKFYCKLDSIQSSGFYKIDLSPEIMAQVKTDFSDIRIVNDTGKWVPHELFFQSNGNQAATSEVPVKFTVKSTDKTSTVLIIEPSKTTNSNFSLEISNTEAERFCSLSGSNDNANWFVINDSILLAPIANASKTKNIFNIDFPPSGYKFFRIIIKNNNRDPFEITGVFQFNSSKFTPKDSFLINPALSFHQKDSGKISYVKIIQKLPYHFDRIYLDLSGPKYFNRKMELFIPYGANHSLANPGALMASINFTNGSSFKFDLPKANADTFYLLIYNEDNLPLSVNAIKTAAKPCFIASYLEKGDNYKLIFDNLSANFPSYDLNSLNKNLTDSAQKIGYGNIQSLRENITVAPAAKNNKWILWVALGGALLILLLFTQKLVKEINHKEQDDHL